MIPVIDIFAGPGGLNEGFSQVRDAEGNRVFDIRGSFEMESRAIETLALRAAYRLFSEEEKGRRRYHAFLASGGQVDLRAEFPAAFQQAEKHVHQIKLGEDTRLESDRIIEKSLSGDGDFVLVGGPPCQAYSLVGRSRRAHDTTFLDDEKHFLFREYLHILEEHRPAVFVMENVKGLLSATHGDTRMFERIREDLELDADYRIRSLVVAGDDPGPRDFVIRAERYGVPQKRHRVILLGIREDLDAAPVPLQPRGPVTLHDAIANLPAFRSILTSGDSQDRWESARYLGLARAGAIQPREQSDGDETDAEALRRWLRVGEVPVSQHADHPRRHMAPDVSRYAYYAAKLTQGRRPRVHELPDGLRPAHKNVDGAGTPFSDRFHVQGWGEPSSTIVSHLSKDGHHFIHPDPMQARSLSVREAARLQTFPDDYWFCGPRTAQFQQVGNAVPPYLAKQIGDAVHRLMRG